MQILENETELNGTWLEQCNDVVACDVCIRIQWLIENSFKEIASLNWEIIYQDISDNRFWLLTYPQSHLHGGGPPCIKNITENQVNERLQNVKN